MKTKRRKSNYCYQ